MHHGVSGKLLPTAGTLKLTLREVFDDALFVALYQGSFAALFVPWTIRVRQGRIGHRDDGRGK